MKTMEREEHRKMERDRKELEKQLRKEWKENKKKSLLIKEMGGTRETKEQPKKSQPLIQEVSTNWGIETHEPE